MVARLMAESNRARSSRSNSAAVRTRMPAAFRRQRAASGKNGSCRWNLRELLLHHAADEHHGQHPLAGFVRAQHVDHVAAAVLEAQGLEPQHRFHGAPEILDADLARGVERRGGFVQRLFEEIERRGLAAPLQRQLVRGGLGRADAGRKRLRRVAKRAAQFFGRERERAPLFQRGERIPACAAGDRRRGAAGLPRRAAAPSPPRPALGICSRTSKSKRSSAAGIGEARRQAQHGEGGARGPSRPAWRRRRRRGSARPGGAPACVSK